MQYSNDKPTKWSQELYDEVLRRVMEGKSLKEVSEMGDMPPMYTIVQWFNGIGLPNKKADDDKKVYEATVANAHIEFEKIKETEQEIKTIADNAILDPKERKVQIDARLNIIKSTQWRLARQVPKKYAERLLAELTGRDGGPIEHTYDDSVIESVAKKINELERSKPE